MALGLTALSGALVYGNTGTAAQVLIRGAGGRWIFPQNAVETVTVPGPLGDTVVELREREVRVLSSPCLNQTCVTAGKIRAPGQWLVCLPNRVFVSVEGKAPAKKPLEEVDGLVW